MHGNSTTVNDGVKKCNNYNEGEEAMLILIDVEENFNSNLTADPFRWIPKGLMEDLMDNTPTEIFPVTDIVNGFTISQLFNGLQSDVVTLQQYRARLIQQNPSVSATNITNLFGLYNY